jgi:hypothetical protein
VNSVKELIDMTITRLQGLGFRPLQRWRVFLLVPLLLVAVGCGGGGETDEAGTPGDTPPPAAGGALPDNLVGTWKTTLGYVPGYYTGIVPNDDFIGSLGISLYFRSNGSYQFDLSSAASYFGGNCFRTTQWSETGSAALAGADLTFTSTHASNFIMDSCGAAKIVDPAPTGTATYTVTRTQDATGWPVLRLRRPGGEDLVLERCRDCGG